MLIVTALKVNTVICPMSRTQLSVLYDVQSVDFSGAEERVGTVAPKYKVFSSPHPKKWCGEEKSGAERRKTMRRGEIVLWGPVAPKRCVMKVAAPW